MKLTPEQRDAILREYYEGIVYHSDEDTTKKLRHDRVEQFAVRCAEILKDANFTLESKTSGSKKRVYFLNRMVKSFVATTGDITVSTTTNKNNVFGFLHRALVILGLDTDKPTIFEDVCKKYVKAYQEGKFSLIDEYGKRILTLVREKYEKV